MGPYSVPKKILANKPPSTMIKKISGNYYVYSCTYEKIIVTDNQGNTRNKTKTIPGKCIGKMSSDGKFISNENKVFNGEILVKKYGAYSFAILNSKETLINLKKYFQSDDALRIYCIALINFINGFTYIKNIKMEYEMSYLSICFPGLKMGYDAISKLYSDLGSRTSQVDAFSQYVIDMSSKLLTFDGHVISCSSEENFLSEYGYKYKRLNSKQINWMTIYDMQDGKPLVSQFYNGAIPDQSLVEKLFCKFSFKNTHFNVDRAFNNSYNIEYMSSNGNSYTMPMISGRKNYNFVISNLVFDVSNCFTYKGGAFLYKEFSGFNKDRYIAYKDLVQANKEQEAYEYNIEIGSENYTEEKLESEKLLFGLFLLETNNFQLDAQEIFYTYKSRWKIETYYNYVKNKAYFKSLYQQDYFKIQGLSFLTCVSGMIFQNVKSSIGKLSISNVMNQLGILVIHLERNNWNVLNKNKSVRDLCDRLNFSVPDIIDLDNITID